MFSSVVRHSTRNQKLCVSVFGIREYDKTVAIIIVGWLNAFSIVLFVAPQTKRRECFRGVLAYTYIYLYTSIYISL